MTQHRCDVLVVGAGLAGLMAATTLDRQGMQVTLLDKGRSVGGRLATRRIGPGRADHGAQFFTVRRPTFQVWVEQWLFQGLVYRWSTGWAGGSLASPEPDGHPRYAVQGGMNSLAKHLADGLDVRVKTQATTIISTGNGWRVRDEAGQFYDSRALLMTPPVPQALALLDAGPVALAPADRTALEQISYAPCLAGLFWVDGLVHLPEPGAIQRPEADISWIADNRRKGISPEATIITIHGGPAFSQRLWPESKPEALTALQAELQMFLDPTARITEAQLKRWRYAVPTTLHTDPCLKAALVPPLVFAGDAFGEPRVEGAALSGLAAAAAIIAELSTSRD